MKTIAHKNQNIKILIAFLLAGMMSTTITGCGDGSGLRLVHVSGKVTVGGSQPFAKGVVRFMPAKPGKLSSEAADTDENGNFTLKHRGTYTGIEAGDYLVSFSLLQMPDGTALPDQSGKSEPLTAVELGAVDFVPKDLSDPGSTKNPVSVSTKGGSFNFDIPELKAPKVVPKIKKVVR
jgi:hypothetical protein